MAPTPVRTARVWLKTLRIGFLPVGAAIFAAMPVPILAGLDIPLAWPVILAIYAGVAAHIAQLANHGKARVGRADVVA